MKPLVFLASSDPADGPWLASCLGDGFELIGTPRADQALAGLAQRQPHVLVVGALLADAPAQQLLAGVARIAAMRNAPPPPIVLLAGRRAPVASEETFFIASREMSPLDVFALIASAAGGRPLSASSNAASAQPQSTDEARRLRRAFDASRRLAAQRDLAGTETTCASIVVDLLDCDRAYCLFHDGDTGALWSDVAMTERGADDRRAARGLAGFSARTGLPATAEAAARDPRYHKLIDDPTGRGDERLLTQPIFQPGGADGRVHAVLVAVRHLGREPFTPEDSALFGAFAAHAAPFLEQLSTHLHAQSIIEDAEAEHDVGQALFRREALEAHGARRYGDVVRVTPSWLGFAYGGMALLLAGAVAYLCIGRVSTYSTGMAVIRAADRTDITARSAGTVSAVAIEAGQKVTAGTLIARLDDAEIAAAVERSSREFEAALRSHLLNPGDGGAEAAVRAHRSELDRSRSSLEERVVRAPVDGVVTDIRVRPGQRVVPGDLVAAMAEAGQHLEVLAFMPGGDRPQIMPGMSVRLELLGFQYAYQDLKVDVVSADVIGPTEARRFLGPQIGDSLPLGGPVVVVRAQLPTDQFVADDKTYTYHDGMSGIAEIRVRSEPILYALVPGLRRL